MAEKTKLEKEETRQVFVPLLKDVFEDKVVVVNGHRYVIKRGEYVDVPLSVFEVLQHEAKMQRMQMEYEAELERRRKEKVVGA